MPQVKNLRKNIEAHSHSNKRQLVSEILKRFEQRNPSPHCELYYRTPYQLLVSVVLSAQATDKQVNKVMKPLYDRGLEPQDVLNWGRHKLLQRIKSIGLAPTKAKNIYALTKILTEDFNGTIPNDKKILQTLPGVGPKTANVILAELFNYPTLAVDTHVFRVTQRLGLQNSHSPHKAEQQLLELIDPKFLPRAHHWFILHGRYICIARKPKCVECLLRDICPYPKKGET